jgi:hypothetical protein
MKKIYLLLILAFFPIFLFGCSQSRDTWKSIKDIVVENTNKKESKDWDVTKNECMQWCKIMRKSNKWNEWKSPNEMQKDCNSLCDASQWIQNNDLSSCERSEWILRDSCYAEIAKTSKDADICTHIEDNTLMNACYSSVAQETKDASICDNIDAGIFKDVCIQWTKE